jgi:hypothetical protein
MIVEFRFHSKNVCGRRGECHDGRFGEGLKLS